MTEDEAFKAPEEASPTMADGEDDIGEIRIPMILPLAAFTALVAALFLLSSGAQGYTIPYDRYGWLQYGWRVYLLGGMAGIVFGGPVYTGRVIWAVLALANLMFCALFAGIWTLYHLYHGAIVPLPAITGMVSLLAALLVALAIPAAARLSVQRARLYS